MIGYYVHHVGHGHLHRALVVAEALGEPVTGLSSLPAPPDWPGPWIQLERDDADPHRDPSPRGRLHWVPLGHRGLRARMAEVASWLRHVEPSVVVVDVSVEIALLVRLHGIPIVTLVGPGERGDPAHLLGFDIADALVGCWPAGATGMLRGVPPPVLDRVQAVGAVSRFPPAEPTPSGTASRRVVVLGGTGGQGIGAADVERARHETPDWKWTILDGSDGTWVDDPFPLLCAADVVVTHAGQNALAEVAAARTPAVVVPQARPHREQEVTAEALWHDGWPAVVVDMWPDHDWEHRLEQAARLDGADWASWCDGLAAGRIAEVVRSVALGERP